MTDEKGPDGLLAGYIKRRASSGAWRLVFSDKPLAAENVYTVQGDWPDAPSVAIRAMSHLGARFAYTKGLTFEEMPKSGTVLVVDEAGIGEAFPFDSILLSIDIKAGTVKAAEGIRAYVSRWPGRDAGQGREGGS